MVKGKQKTENCRGQKAGVMKIGEFQTVERNRKKGKGENITLSEVNTLSRGRGVSNLPNAAKKIGPKKKEPIPRERKGKPIPS